MKMYAIAIALCLWVSALPQTGSFERQALNLVQATPASDLDSKLPKLPFGSWYSQLIGPQAGVVWQLTECGEISVDTGNDNKDLRACMEVNAGLPDGRKVIVAIAVGTFKKGITGKPSFFRAVVEREEQLYEASRLSEVSAMLHPPKDIVPSRLTKKTVGKFVKLPTINSGWMKFRLLDPTNPPPLLLPESKLQPDSSDLESAPSSQQSNPSFGPSRLIKVITQPDAKSQTPQKVEDGVLNGNAVTRVKPEYPQNAKMMNALGTVKVQITISETGRVIEAKALSGHMALRNAAVDAAYKWVFKPTLLNNVPIRVQGILNFDFTNNSEF